MRALAWAKRALHSRSSRSRSVSGSGEADACGRAEPVAGSSETVPFDFVRFFLRSSWV